VINYYLMSKTPLLEVIFRRRRRDNKIIYSHKRNTVDAIKNDTTERKKEVKRTFFTRDKHTE